jgi:hypothetical protein
MALTPSGRVDSALLRRTLPRAMRFLASLKLAVVLIAVYAVVIAWASILESSHGTVAVHFGVYETWWFLALNVLLAINVLLAAVVRFPWRRRQTGFVITHSGILLLMAGCLLSWRGGIEARLPVAEGHSSGRAYQDSRHLLLRVSPKNGGAAEDRAAGAETVRIPFVGGPFDWKDYHGRLFWFPWRLAPRSSGLLYDSGGVRLEALDYLAVGQEPRVRLRLSIDGAAEEFWLADSDDERSSSEGEHTLDSPQRRATVSMSQDTVELGFLVFLQKFQGKLDAGSLMPSHYSSLVDFIAPGPSPRRLQENVVITLNSPVDFTDPANGRTWRLFQSSFDGPWKPGSRQFQALAGKDRSRDQIYLSILTLSYDPGRALKYLGSLLVVMGVAVVYYVRVQGTAGQAAGNAGGRNGREV